MSKQLRDNEHVKRKPINVISKLEKVQTYHQEVALSCVLELRVLITSCRRVAYKNNYSPAPRGSRPARRRAATVRGRRCAGRGGPAPPPPPGSPHARGSPGAASRTPGGKEGEEREMEMDNCMQGRKHNRQKERTRQTGGKEGVHSDWNSADKGNEKEKLDWLISKACTPRLGQ